MASASADTAGRILVKKFVVNYYTQSGPFSTEARELFSTRRDLRKVLGILP